MVYNEYSAAKFGKNSLFKKILEVSGRLLNYYFYFAECERV